MSPSDRVPAPQNAATSRAAGTTATDRLDKEGAGAGVAPGEVQDARPGDLSKVGGAQTTAASIPDVPVARFGEAVDIARDFVSGWTAMLPDDAVNEWARQLYDELRRAFYGDA